MMKMRSGMAAILLAGTVGGVVFAGGASVAGERASSTSDSARLKLPALSRYPEFQETEDRPAKLPRLPAESGVLSPAASEPDSSALSDRLADSDSFGNNFRASFDAENSASRLSRVGTGVKPPTPSELAEARKAGWEPVEQLIYGGDNGEYDSPGAYRFVVRDRLRILVEGHSEFEGEVQVQQDGTIAIPNSNDYLPAQGRTCEELAGDIAKLLSPYIRTPPHVQVKPVRGQGGYYYIFGEVGQQGRFPMGLEPIHLSEAVFRANSSVLGGPEEETRESRLEEETSIQPRQGFSLSDYVRLTQVSVITPHRSHPTRRIYNVKKALLQGVTGEDPFVRPGQIIWVPNTTDKRMMKFITRVIDPLNALQNAEGTGDYWYSRMSGNKSDNSENTTRTSKR